MMGASDGDVTFCGECQADSEARSPGGVSASNGIGRKFYGNADRCDNCGSVGRVLWVCIAHVPLIPLGSYRYLEAGGFERRGLSTSTRFLARRTPMRWGQVALHWCVGLGAAVLAVVVMAMWHSSKR